MTDTTEEYRAYLIARIDWELCRENKGVAYKALVKARLDEMEADQRHFRAECAYLAAQAEEVGE